jgi:uncharacterized protein (TIGR02246 family)
MNSHDDDGIRILVDRFSEAWNAHNPAGIAALFSKDGDFVNVIGMRCQGQEAIEAIMTRNHAAIFKDSRLEVKNVDIRHVRSDVAIVHATWVLSGELGFDGNPLPQREGLVTYALTREETGWEIAAFQNTNIIRPTGAAAH